MYRYKVEKGVKLEPIEEVTIEVHKLIDKPIVLSFYLFRIYTKPLGTIFCCQVDDEHVGLVMEALSHRRGEVTDMGPVPGSMGRSRMCLTCPSRYFFSVVLCRFYYCIEHDDTQLEDWFTSLSLFIPAFRNNVLFIPRISWIHYDTDFSSSICWKVSYLNIFRVR